MQKVYSILFSILLCCVGCQWQLKPHGDDVDNVSVMVARYDRIENLYLTTGDYSALQQMNTYFPMQTRTLIEDVLRIGKVDAPDINTKFLYFFQDSTLQQLLVDVQRQYADMDDISDELSDAFGRLKDKLPALELPQVYAQIGSFDQSIVVGHRTLGISLDKYLGADYPFYQNNYTVEQRRMMTRSMMVPDCIGFYLLSIYPMPSDRQLSQSERDWHMGKIQWVVNQVTRHDVFKNDYVKAIDRYMKQDHHRNSFEQMLLNNNYGDFR